MANTLRFTPPATDARYKRLLGAMNKHGRRRDALIEILHVAEDAFGYIPLDVMRYIAQEMKIPPSRIYGVVTFYHFFTLKPKGEHNCLVCTGTACHVKGAQGVLHQIQKAFGVLPGETTPDGKFGLQTARCLGCCGLAPVMVVDDQILANVNADDAPGLVRKKLEKQS